MTQKGYGKFNTQSEANDCALQRMKRVQKGTICIKRYNRALQLHCYCDERGMYYLMELDGYFGVSWIGCENKSNLEAYTKGIK